MIKANLVDPVDIEQYEHLEIKALVRAVDPDGEYFDAQAFSELLGAAEKPADVGLALRREGPGFRVVEVVPDSPAADAGLAVGDRVLDGVLPKGLSMPDGTLRMRVLPRVSIRLMVLQAGQDAPVERAIKWHPARLNPVSMHDPVPGYVHVRIGQFAAGTGGDLARQLNERFRQEAPKGLVLDLRDSTGGLLNEAVGIAAVFLPPGALVARFSGQSQHSNFSVHASPHDYLRRESDYLKRLHPDVKQVPLVVLVNARTAAGAEIVAAALQDHQRAMIVGTSTFGRATIQTIFPLEGRTALKLTTARWVSPQKRSVHGIGLAPDELSHTQPGKTSGQADSPLERALIMLKAR